MTLEETRKKIDLVDSEIINMLNERMELILKARNFKKDIEDPAREKEVIENVKKSATLIVNSGFSEEIFKSIVKESKNVQKQHLKLVGFQGEHGAYGEIGIRVLDKNAVPIPCTEFADVFEGVKSGQLDSGLVPIENSIEGPVNQVNDLLIESDLGIVGEMNLPVHHCLLAIPDTDYREIKVVYSHPQALGQCRGFISRNKLEARPYYDTAGAAQMLAKERPKAAAVIASKLCAEIYGLEILKENIEDHESNSTRFIIVAKEKSSEKGDKCSVVFSTLHRAGALFSVLKIFSDSNINLTRIESRPIRKEPKKFAFLLDFQGSDKDQKIIDAMEKMKRETAMFKFLGCYKGDSQ
ncbi:MAG: prephenate dehydratase [Candidatus Micrarchaeota archaeon]|nr:prephenate dehydratase [Candidatus Micrarchaeota archaeon]